MTSRTAAQEALASARAAVFWSDRPDSPEPADALVGPVDADLTIVGGGFTGLWAAIQMLEDKPGANVVVLEAETCGFGASNRNGGFCDASLTHGLENGISHWPDEVGTLVSMGIENLDAIEATVSRYRIDADFQRTAEISVATEPWHLTSMPAEVEAYAGVDVDAEFLDEQRMQTAVHSPTYLGGVIVRGTVALVDPARLCWGLRSAALSLGARIFEGSPVRRIDDEPTGVHVHTAKGVVRSASVIVATNAYRAPVKSPGRYTIPVYDHVLMTEPLSSEQMASIGWRGREGIGDASNQFHYYRLSEDDRILWGGYDATYHYRNGVDPAFDQSEETHGMLAEHFFETFPQLAGLKFSHRWGGPIGTTSRFTAAWGTSHKGRLVWAVGYTGLGVGASRFGARVALDLVLGQTTERTELEMVRKKPFPIPPEPLRWASVQATRKAIQRADHREGRRGAWLSLLDKFGIGFDS